MSNKTPLFVHMKKIKREREEEFSDVFGITYHIVFNVLFDVGMCIPIRTIYFFMLKNVCSLHGNGPIGTFTRRIKN
jgi:hypothetical protein